MKNQPNSHTSYVLNVYVFNLVKPSAPAWGVRGVARSVESKQITRNSFCYLFITNENIKSKNSPWIWVAGLTGNKTGPVMLSSHCPFERMMPDLEKKKKKSIQYAQGIARGAVAVDTKFWVNDSSTWATEHISDWNQYKGAYAVPVTPLSVMQNASRLS